MNEIAAPVIGLCHETVVLPVMPAGRPAANSPRHFIRFDAEYYLLLKQSEPLLHRGYPRLRPDTVYGDQPGPTPGRDAHRIIHHSKKQGAFLYHLLRLPEERGHVKYRLSFLRTSPESHEGLLPSTA